MTSPVSAEASISALSSVYQNTSESTSAFDVASELIRRGLTSGSVSVILDALAGLFFGENSDSNSNVREPAEAVYPFAADNDAPYDVSEDQLRGAIYIPSTFKYGAPGAPQPIILVPGTSHTAYENFRGNWIPLLEDNNIGDPVWLNIPGNMLNDVQTNAEYIAYAINYIYVRTFPSLLLHPSEYLDSHVDPMLLRITRSTVSETRSTTSHVRVSH